MNAKRVISLLLTIMMCVGLFGSIVLPAAAASDVYIIDPSGTDGESGSVDCSGVTVRGTVYTSYEQFEANYTGSGADVYFTSGEFDGLTVTKPVNIYGAKKGIDPNVKGVDKLQPWTLNDKRGNGETVFTGKVLISASVKKGYNH